VHRAVGVRGRYEELVATSCTWECQIADATPQLRGEIGEINGLTDARYHFGGGVVWMTVGELVTRDAVSFKCGTATEDVGVDVPGRYALV
jgi:hypothetical protein